MKNNIFYSVSEFLDHLNQGARFNSFESEKGSKKGGLFVKIGAVVSAGAVALSLFLLPGLNQDNKKALEYLQKEKEFQAVNFNNDYKKIPIYKLKENKNGVYFLDPSAKYENEIFVDWESINKWGLDEVEIGEKVMGVFDSTGWELLDAWKIYSN